jgi:hypothetical protein
MSLIGLIVALVVLGVLLWVVETIIPLDPTIRRLIQVLVVLAVLIFVLRAFGLF